MDPLDVYPIRREVAWDDVDNRVVIALPRDVGAVGRLFAKLMPVAENRLVSLEDQAADFWRKADGRNSLRAIAGDLTRKGEAGEAAQARVIVFARDLERRGFLEIRAQHGAANDRLRGLTPQRGFFRLACGQCDVVHPIQAKPGAKWACPRCQKVNRVPKTP